MAESDPPYADQSPGARETLLRRLLSAALGVSSLGQDATLSYEMLGTVPAIATQARPDLTPLWTCLQKAQVPTERGGRLLTAMRLYLQRGYAVTPLLPDAARAAMAEALQRAGSEDALWIQVNAALVRSLAAGAGAGSEAAAAGTAAGSIAAQRKEEQVRAERRQRQEDARARRGKRRGAGTAAQALIGKLAKNRAGVVALMIALVLCMIIMVYRIINF